MTLTKREKVELLVGGLASLVGGVALWWMNRPMVVTITTTPNPNAPASTVATQGLGADARRRARYS